MTVVLCGVGADTGNVRPVPAVDADGRFEYVPIPEKGATTETATYDSIERRHGEGVLADLLDGIRPGSDGEWVTDERAIREQPVHHDPNLDALTYGEHRPGYVAKLRELETGDVVAFYGGFPGPDSTYKHRSLFGYFTVTDSPTVLDPEMGRTEKRALLDDHPENAHAKRAEDGVPFYDDKRLVVLAGREPGGLFERDPVRLSEYRERPDGRGGYYLDPAVAERFDIVEGSDYMTRKPALVGDAFVDLVGRPGER